MRDKVEREREKEKEKRRKKGEKKRSEKSKKKVNSLFFLSFYPLTCSVESVIPATCASGNARASSLEVPPIPHPTSKTRLTGGLPGSLTPDHSSILSTKSTLAALKSLRR